MSKKYEKPTIRSLQDVLPNANGTCARGTVANQNNPACSTGSNPSNGPKDCRTGGLAGAGCVAGNIAGIGN